MYYISLNATVPPFQYQGLNTDLFIPLYRGNTLPQMRIKLPVTNSVVKALIV